MSSSSEDPARHADARNADARRHGEPDRRGGDADMRVDSLLRGVDLRGMRRQNLVTLFSDEAIDRLLRDVPSRTTPLRAFAADPGRRVPVDLEAISGGFSRRLVIPAAHLPSRPKRLLRSAIRFARDALNVGAVLALVVATFAASVLSSRWLSRPDDRIAGTPPHALDFTAAAPRLGDPVVEVLPGRRLADAGSTAVAERNQTDGLVSAEAGTATMVDDAAAEGGVDARSQPVEPDHRRIASDGRPDPRSAARPTGSPPELRAAPLTSGLREVVPGRRPNRSAGDSLEVVAGRLPIGRAVPFHRGYDLAFEMTHGEPPFVDPSLTPAVSVDHPPLSRRTDSFDRVVHLLAAGGLRRDRYRQAMADVRVEEFLAALPAVLPAAVLPAATVPAATVPAATVPAATVPAAVPPAAVPPAAVPPAVPVVRLAGAASISGRPATRLLEVSVTAPSSSSRPAGDFLFVLDASAAAGAEEAWPAVCRGVEDVVRRLDPSASITVVVVAERPEVVVEDADASGLLPLRQRLAAIRPRGGGDLHGSLAIVRGLMAARRSSAKCVVIAHAGSIARAERDFDPSIAAWRRSQRSARAGNVSTEGAGGSSGRPGAPDGGPLIEVVEIDAVSGATGEAAGRIGLSLVDGVGLDSMLIRRSIVSAALGNEAAPRFEGCRLEVSFDPAQVAAYRLVGHRRQVADMVASRSHSVDLADGECVRVVYELVLRERDPRGRSVGSSKEAFLAKATCRYRRRGDATESSIVAGISATQLAVDPKIDDPLGQAVWLAVAVAEQASGSVHIQSPQRLRDSLRRRFDGVGIASAGSPGDGPHAEARSILRQLHDIWTPR